uniref:Uncharacterized protein n=1 Tax=Timspurckia oligopyrenoides TaxID=708627 RepID=A0A7S1ESV9_9RHOD
MFLYDSMPNSTGRDRLRSIRSLLLWITSRFLDKIRSPWTPWILSCLIFLYILALNQHSHTHHTCSTKSNTLNLYSHNKSFPNPNKFCILQPVLSPSHIQWNSSTITQHSALHLFLTSFIQSYNNSTDSHLNFHMYYGHDADDSLFSNQSLVNLFITHAQTLTNTNPMPIHFHFIPLYQLHSRITAIWNELAFQAYNDGCSYFFLSNDDMLIYTKGWTSQSVNELNRNRGTVLCQQFGIVRFKDEWADWAKFTFHVSTRFHMDIFDKVYYPIPFKTTHNDYWIYQVYRNWRGDYYESKIKMRNRVVENGSKEVAEPRYEYDKKEGIHAWVNYGSERVEKWMKLNHKTHALCSNKGKIQIINDDKKQSSSKRKRKAI